MARTMENRIKVLETRLNYLNKPKTDVVIYQDEPDKVFYNGNLISPNELAELNKKFEVITVWVVYDQYGITE